MSVTRSRALIEFQTERRIAALTRPANTTTYAAGDVISDATADAYLTFDDCANKGPSLLTGVISGAKAWSSASVATKPDIELWLFRSAIAARADNAAIAFTDAEMLDCLGVIQFPLADWFVGLATAGAGGNCINQQNNVGIPYQLAGAAHIYAQPVVRNAYIPISGEIFTFELMLTID